MVGQRETRINLWKSLWSVKAQLGKDDQTFKEAILRERQKRARYRLTLPVKWRHSLRFCVILSESTRSDTRRIESY
jgi:hypothetical protein